jgi:DNA ligase (NAD+)|tara:strand:- start:411 stop:1172 length:762 start_codon:yes stop_codon:yes gene_type:complete
MRGNMQQILPPTNCPACGSTLEWEKDQLFCVRTTCGGRTHKMIQHFAKTLRIKGLGPRTIEKLEITSIYDLYQLPLEMMIDALNSEKLAVKLHREIYDSKNTDLVDLLPAFSIPLIGRTASAKICSKIRNISEIDEEVCKEAGLGPKATDNLLNWLIEDFTDGYDRLPFRWQQLTKIESKSADKGIVCISGKLKSYSTKAAAKKILEQKGYLVKSSMTKDVNILVNESGVESAKTRAARSKGITIITNLKDLI